MVYSETGGNWDLITLYLICSIQHFHQYIQFEAIISWETNTDFTFKLHLNLNAFFLLFSIYKGTCKRDQR